MDPIRLLLSLILGLFPCLLQMAAIPLAASPRLGSRQKLRDYAIGHDWLGWYRITLEMRATGWPTLRVIAISDWSRRRPDRFSGSGKRVSRRSKQKFSATPPNKCDRRR